MQGTILDGDDNVDADGKCTAEVVEMEGTAEADGNRDVSPSSLAVVMEEDKDDGGDMGMISLAQYKREHFKSCR
jgi:hypothetical protein